MQSTNSALGKNLPHSADVCRQSRVNHPTNPSRRCGAAAAGLVSQTGNRTTCGGTPPPPQHQSQVDRLVRALFPFLSAFFSTLLRLFDCFPSDFGLFQLFFVLAIVVINK